MPATNRQLDTQHDSRSWTVPNVDQHYSSDTVSILLGNGDGTFQTQVQYGTGSGPGGVNIADVNGDDKVDLLIPNQLSGTISVLLGNGDGTFGQAVDYPVSAGAVRADVGDFNQDGKLDLAVATFKPSVDILLGKGDGTFQAPSSFPTGNNPWSVVAGDFNRDGRLDVATANANDNTVSVLLQTTGGPAVSFSPASLTFAPQPVGTFSSRLQATLTNTGGAALNITNVSRSGDFYLTCNCRGTLQPGASCTMNVTFTPTSAGTRSGDVFIRDNAPGSPQKLPLSGTGSGTGSIILTLSPPSLSFGSVMVGSTSSPQTVTVTNIGTATASFVTPFGFAIGGPNSADFEEQSSCGTSLAPKASCTVAVTFKPTATGARTGSFVVRQGAASVHIPLSGTGT